MIGLSLSIICILFFSMGAQAYDQVEEIYQKLITQPRFDDLRKAAEGDENLAAKTMHQNVRDFCKLPGNDKCSKDISYLFKIPADDEFGKKVALKMAKSAWETQVAGLREYAKRLASFNEVAESCMDGTSQLFSKQYQDVCQQKVVCKGAQAEKLMKLFEGAKSIEDEWKLWTPRELSSEETSIEGVDISPLLKKPNSYVDVRLDSAHVPYHMFNGGSTGSSTTKNEELEDKLIKAVDKVLKKIEKNPHGLSKLAADSDGFEVEEIIEFVRLKRSGIDLVEGAKQADLLQRLADESESSEAIPEEEIKKFASEVEIADGQLKEIDLELLKFYKKNAKRIENPIHKSNAYLSLYPSTLPEGIMTMRFMNCEVEKIHEGTKLKKDEQKCELVFSQENSFDAKIKIQGPISGGTLKANIKNSCFKRSPLSFFKSLFSSKKSSSRINTGERGQVEKTSAPVLTPSLAPSAVQK
jgi:hypothetical protein